MQHTAYDIWESVSLTACALITPAAVGIYGAQAAGTSVARAVGVQYGKTLISGGAGYLTNAVGEHYGLSKEARFALVMGAGMLTGFGLEGIDKHFNISGYHRVSVDVEVKTKGWKVGDPIDNLTAEGNEPSWDTVRQRYWKNEVYNYADDYSNENLQLMKTGKAPIHEDFGVSKELHHINGRNIPNPNAANNLQKVWPWQHAEIDPHRYYNGPRP